MTTTTRRSFARGAAWSVPIVATAAAAPAVAASGTVTLARQTYYTAPTTGCSGGQYKLNWDGTTSGFGVTLSNAKSTAATVTGLYIVFWVSVNNLALATSSSTPQWSAPTATGQSMVMNGITYYQYRSNYTGTVSVPAKGSTVVKYAFNGTICRSGTTYITAGQGFAVADGTSIQSAPGSSTTCTATRCQ